MEITVNEYLLKGMIKSYLNGILFDLFVCLVRFDNKVTNNKRSLCCVFLFVEELIYVNTKPLNVQFSHVEYYKISKYPTTGSCLVCSTSFGGTWHNLWLNYSKRGSKFQVFWNVFIFGDFLSFRILLSSSFAQINIPKSWHWLTRPRIKTRKANSEL